MIKLPLVTIIIPTKNEQNNIYKCLESIKNQSYPLDKIEIIIIDNDSTDNTKIIIKSNNLKPLNIILYNHQGERSKQRNYGINKSRGDYLLYLDADMTISSLLINECVNKMQSNPNLIGLYIPEKIIGRTYWSKVRNFERSFYNQTAIDAVRFIRMKDAREINGFDDNLIAGEDWDFDKRIRKRGQTNIIKAIIYHHDNQLSLNNYLSKKKYYSKFINKYIEKWGINDPDIKKQFGLTYRLFGVFIENHKWKKIVKHPLLAMMMIIGKIMVGFLYIYEK